MLCASISRDFPGLAKNLPDRIDSPMLALMQQTSQTEWKTGTEEADQMVIKLWMTKYGLFQGIDTKTRNEIARFVLDVVPAIQWPRGKNRSTAVHEVYEELYRKLYNKFPRCWLSATSKLLWCRFPNEIVIFDSFVQRAIIVLQCVLKRYSPDSSGHTQGS